jgi:acetaldehyde dehydrogenase (acetylating)
MSVRDADLASIQQARNLAKAARAAQAALAGFDQEQIDRIVEAMAEAARAQAEPLARLAHEETGFGNPADKTRKNLFASQDVAAYIRPLKTVGVLREDPQRGVVEIAEPMGVVAAIVPSTNPTSTAIYKALIAIKGRNACVMTPHPSAARSILATVAVMHPAAVRAGLPPDALTCMDAITLEGTQELMRARDTAVVLATGGIGLVRAAYASGKPAYGVGPGNVPVYLDRSADVARAVADVVAGKTFDYGTLCSSEQALVCDQPIHETALAELRRNGAYLLDAREAEALARVVVTPQRLANPEIVGKPATYIAQKAGLTVPPDTRVLVAALAGVGRDYPLSIEKLSPVLALYVVPDWRAGLERCRELLRFGGLGHTAGIHAGDDEVIRAFALAQPASRVIANTQTSLGATGATTGLAPSMSLGCGAHAGNITSDNITPLHLVNIKRLAHGRPRQVALPVAVPPSPAPPSPASAPSPPPAAPESALDFVCEDDVKRARREGRRLRVARGAILTPAARDAAEGTNVLEFEA